MSESRNYISEKYANIRQALLLPNATFKNVTFLSYHLPKTAGTSLYLGLEEVYGAERVKRVYDTTSVQLLTNGKALWVPGHTHVLHGHFRPHINHIKQYPKAKRMVWVRDPIERCWSLLRHWLRMENGPIYARFKAKHMAGEPKTSAALFDLLVHDAEFAYIKNFYQSFFQNMAPNHFHFVAKAEEFDNEVTRLSKFLDKPFKARLANQNTKEAALPFSKSKYAENFRSEYEFLAQQFKIIYSI